MSDAQRTDMPMVDDDTRAWWAACASGRLLVQRCGACARLHHYPRPFCPHCWSDDLSWEEASGRASLYSWSVVYRNPQPPFMDRVPYVPALVELEEGVRMMTEISTGDPGGLQVDMPLRVVFEPLADGLAAPIFIPAR